MTGVTSSSVRGMPGSMALAKRIEPNSTTT